jgi:hypothetical protein
MARIVTSKLIRGVDYIDRINETRNLSSICMEKLFQNQTFGLLERKLEDKVIEFRWGLMKETLPPLVSRMSRKCGSLDLSQSYGPPLPIIGIASLMKIDLRI